LANLRKIPRKSAFSRAGKRLRELDRLIRDRHGVALPDTDDIDLYLAPVVRCFRKITIDKGKPAHADGLTNRLALWCDTRAPNVTADLIADVVRQVLTEASKFDSDDELGATLRVSYSERQRLKITTIGSYDVSRTSLAQKASIRKRERNRLSAAKRRRVMGAMPRAVYEANSLTKNEPWVQLGISRRTYYRRAALAAQTDGGTSPSPHPSFYQQATDLCHVKMDATCLTPKSPDGATKPPADAVSTPSKTIWVGVDGAAVVGHSIQQSRSFKTRFPSAMRLSKAMRAFALEAGFTPDEIQRMFEMYRDINIAQRTYSIDWTEVWFNWVNREATIVNARYDRERARAYFERTAA
jgi:hypothetical protein